MRSWCIQWNSRGTLIFFPCYVIAFWCRSELIWLSNLLGRWGLAGSVVKTWQFFFRPVFTTGCLEHNIHILPPSACRVSTFMFSDSSNPFNLIHDWKITLLNAFFWLTASWNRQLNAFLWIIDFWNCWMLFFQHCWKIVFAATALDVCFFWLANNTYIFFSLTTKVLFYIWMTSFTFLWTLVLKFRKVL